MLNSILSVILATSIMVLSLFGWRVLYAHSDWAAVWLLPLAVILFCGAWSLTLRSWKARLGIALREDSPLSFLLQGKLTALLTASAFTVVTSILLAWQTLIVAKQEAMFILGLLVSSGMAFAILQTFLLRHFHQPFARAVATTTATWLVAIPFTVFFAHYYWANVPVDIEASFTSALQNGLDQLPERRGWIAEMLSPLYAYEAGKAWLAVRLREYPIVAWIFSLDAALFGFLVARASIIVTQRMEWWTARAQDASHWFWGTVCFLAATSMLLGAVGSRPQPDTPHTVRAVEIPQTVLEDILRDAEATALNSTVREIDPLLDKAYEPVYAAIPDYADFHYSLRGEYLLLTASALGTASEAIEQRLFDGLDDRMNGVTGSLHALFEETFHLNLGAGLAGQSPTDIAPGAFGPLTQEVLDDTTARMSATAPIAGTVIVGSLSAKAASKLLAKKIAGKLAAKAAMKAGAKTGTVATGGVTGAAVCAWSGPFAVICGAGGAIVAWVAVDAVVLEIDEVLNRDEFEAELRRLVDEDKERWRAGLERALQDRALEIQKGIDRNLGNMTLKELTRPERSSLCAEAASMMVRYDLFRTNLAVRNPASVSAFLDELQEAHLHPLLLSLAEEVAMNVRVHAPLLTIERVTIHGNLPDAFLGGQDVSAILKLGGIEIASEPAQVPPTSGFTLRAEPFASLEARSPIQVLANLEQHLRFRPNRHYKGSQHLDLFEAMSGDEGLREDIQVQVLLIADEALGSIVDHEGASAEQTLTMVLTLRGNELPALENALECPPQSQE